MYSGRPDRVDFGLSLCVECRGKGIDSEGSQWFATTDLAYSLASKPLLFKNASTALNAMFEQCKSGQGPSRTVSDNTRLSNRANDAANVPR